MVNKEPCELCPRQQLPAASSAAPPGSNAEEEGGGRGSEEAQRKPPRQQKTIVQKGRGRLQEETDVEEEDQNESRSSRPSRPHLLKTQRKCVRKRPEAPAPHHQLTAAICWSSGDRVLYSLLCDSRVLYSLLCDSRVLYISAL
uniref:Uncharacterized protein n=1 Tax=Knipowitschia caucasica TaxID=637954 RepID=A0AAV2JI78_KNICA